VVSDIHENFL